jgi:hypothetical protein
MDLIYQNPFRVLGLPVTATDREIAKQIGDMAIYADMGKTIEYDSDLFFPIKPNRTTESIQEAKQKIDRPDNKLFYSLFWFWENSNNTIDEMAFEELKNGNIEKAIEFWERETEKGITSLNKSNHKNLFILRLGLSLQNGKLDKNHLLNSLSLSVEFFPSGHFEKFAKQVLGVKHSVDLLETTNHYFDEIFSMVKPHISKRKSENKVTHREILVTIEPYSLIYGQYKEKNSVQQIHNIEKQIEKCEQARKDSANKAKKSGFDLHKNTQEDLKQLQSVLNKSDLKYQLVADKLAEELLGCSIAYFNKYYDSNTDPGDASLKLLKHAKEIAVGDKIKDKITDNQPNVEEYVNNKSKREKLKPVKTDFDFIYKKIENFVSFNGINKPQKIISFINSCRPKLKNIARKLGINDSDFIEISDIVGNVGVNQCVAILNMAVEYVNKEMPHDEYRQSMALQQIKTDVEPALDKIGELRLSSKNRREFNELNENIGISPMGEDDSWSNLRTTRQTSSGATSATYTCLHCGKIYKSKYYHGEHEKHCDDSTSSTYTSSATSATYTCLHCGKIYKSKYYHGEHEKHCDDSTSSTYTSSDTEENYGWVGWIIGIIIFLILMENC